MIPGLGRSPGEGIGYPLGKETACSAGDLGSTRGSGRSPGGQHGNPLPRSCLENSRCRGTWRAAVHGVAKSWTKLSDKARTEEESRTSP